MNKETLKHIEGALSSLQYGEVIIKIVDNKVIMIEKKEQFKIKN